MSRPKTSALFKGPPRALLFLLMVLALLLMMCTEAGAAPGDASLMQVKSRWGSGPAYATDASADLLLIGEGSLVRVFDNTDPHHPTAIGEALVAGVVMGLYREGNLVYVAAAQGGLRVVDVSDPANPFEAGGVLTPGTAYGIHVVGNRAYLSDSGEGLRIYDLTSPTSPVELGFFDDMLYAMDSVVVGNLAYVADFYDEALKVLDVADPSNIVLLDSDVLPGAPWGLDVVGSLAVIVDDYTGITTFDLSVPWAPVQNGTAWLTDVGYDVKLHGHVAVVANNWEGLVLMDLSALPSISFVSAVDTPGYGYGLAIFSDVAYLADSQGGVQVVDIATPASPVAGDLVRGVGRIRKVFTDGALSYVVDEHHGLRILESAQGGGAVELGAVEIGGSPQEVDVEGGIAYVAATTAGVVVIDVIDPTNPTILYTIPLPTYQLGSGAMAVSVDGDRLGVVDKYFGFYLFDVTNPATPFLIGDLGTGSYPRCVILRGDYAYIADRDGSIRIIDITTVTQISYADYIGFNIDLELEGDLLFVAKDWRGVWVVDVSDPTTLEHVDLLELPLGVARAVSAVYPHLYIGDYATVRIYDYADPVNPFEVGHYEVDDYVLGLCATGRSVHVAGMAGGWYELENLVPVGAPDLTPQPAKIALEPAMPNPFNPRTTLRFALARAGHARLEVIDAAGRSVKVLIDEWRDAGPQLTSWDGTDGRGVPVASGVYRYRLESANRSQARGMVLVR